MEFIYTTVSYKK